MITDKEYLHYNKCIDSLFDKSIDIPADSDGDHLIEIWNIYGERTTLDKAFVISFYEYVDEDINHFINIDDVSVIIQDVTSIKKKFKDFSTESFITNSDEEFFQASTIYDFSFADEKFIRRLIGLSILIRNNRSTTNE